MLKSIADMSVDIDRVSVCPMGVELRDLFKPVDGTKREKFRLIFVGRLVEKKVLLIF